MFGSRVRETCTAAGTGPISLQGAVTGFVTFVAGLSLVSARFVFYVVTNGTDWEWGVGKLTPGTPDSLERTHIYASSNGGSPIVIGAGTYSVFNGVPPNSLDNYVNPQSGAYTLLPTDFNKLVAYTGTADRSWALPKAAEVGNGFNLAISHHGTAGALTIDPDGSETIDGGATAVIRPGQALVIVSDGTNWRIASAKGYFGTGIIDLTGATLSNVTLQDPTLNGSQAIGSLLGIAPRKLVTADMLGDIAFLNKIAQGQIDAGAVQTADIAALAITSALLGGGAVTGPKLTGGMVVNFGYAVKSSVFTLTGASSNVFTDITDLSVAMAAPRDANSSYLIFGVVNVGDSGGKFPMLRLVDGSGTAIGVGASAGSREQASTQVYTTNSNAMIAAPLMGRHAPASVSAQTIKAQIRTQSGGDTVYVNQCGTDANAGTTGRGFSMLAVAEIAG